MIRMFLKRGLEDNETSILTDLERDADALLICCGDEEDWIALR